MFRQKSNFIWERYPIVGGNFLRDWRGFGVREWRRFRPYWSDVRLHGCFSPKTRKKLELEYLKMQAKFFEEGLKEIRKMIEEFEAKEKEEKAKGEKGKVIKTTQDLQPVEKN